MFGVMHSFQEKIPIEIQDNFYPLQLTVLFAEKFLLTDQGDTVKWEMFDGDDRPVLEMTQTKEGFDKSNIFRRLTIRSVR